MCFNAAPGFVVFGFGIIWPGLVWCVWGTADLEWPQWPGRVANTLRLGGIRAFLMRQPRPSCSYLQLCNQTG